MAYKGPIVTAKLPNRDGRDGSYHALLDGQLLHLTYASFGEDHGGRLYIPSTVGASSRRRVVYSAAAFISKSRDASATLRPSRKMRPLFFIEVSIGETDVSGTGRSTS